MQTPEARLRGTRTRKHKHRRLLPVSSSTDAVPVYQALRAALPEWEKLGANPWVTDTIRNGIKLEFASTPTRFRSKEYPLNADDAAFMKTEIQRELDNGYIRQVTDPKEMNDLQCISSAFVAHTARKPRVVYDYKHTNSFMINASCKYETLYDLADTLRPNDALLSWDIKDAYHHLLVRKKDRTFLAFRALGRVFVPLTMPFGVRPAPRIWTKVCRPVVQWLRERGFRMIAYVDDFGGAPPTEGTGPATSAEAVLAYQTVSSLLTRLGLRMHPVKGVRHGPTSMPLLGHVIDTSTGLFTLPADRVANIVNQARTLSLRATSHNRWVSFRALRRFCGTAVSSTLSVPTARFHLRSLFNALRFKHPTSGDTRLGHQALRDLQWWLDLEAHSAGGRPIWPGTATMQMDTDASGVGWGAVLSAMVETRGYHGTLRSGLDINVLELGAVTLAIESFRSYIPRGTILRLRTDSMVALGVIQAQSSRSLTLMSEYRRLHTLCAELDIELRAEHVSSALNERADRLSRENDSTNWTINSTTYARLNNLYGPHTVDLFATELNTRCTRFYSRRPSPGALGVNALAQDWSGENAWANPPFHLLGPVITRIILTSAAVTLIVPVWRAQAWWSQATRHATEWNVLPDDDGIHTHGSQSRPGRRPFWQTAVFRFGPTPHSATTSSDGTPSSGV